MISKFDLEYWNIRSRHKSIGEASAVFLTSSIDFKFLQKSFILSDDEREVVNLIEEFSTIKQKAMISLLEKL